MLFIHPRSNSGQRVFCFPWSDRCPAAETGGADWADQDLSGSPKIQIEYEENKRRIARVDAFREVADGVVWDAEDKKPRTETETELRARG